MEFRQRIRSPLAPWPSFCSAFRLLPVTSPLAGPCASIRWSPCAMNSSVLPFIRIPQARRKLDMLDAAQDIRTLSTLPGNRVERLRGDRKGQYSIRVNDQWRICFEWRDGHAYEVEIVDYH